MAKAKKILEADPDATDITHMTSEQKEKKLLRDLENARRKELQFEEFAQQQTKNLEDLAKQKDTVYFGKSLEDLPPDLKQKTLEDIKSRGRTLAKDIYEDPIAMEALEIEKKYPSEGLGKASYIGGKYSPPPSFAEELKQTGVSGELIANKFKEAGINIDEATKAEALQEMERLSEASRSTKRVREWLEQGMPMDTTPVIKDPEGARDVDIGKIKNQIAREKQFSNLKSSMGRGTQKVLGALPKVATGLGAVGAAMDVKEGNIPEVGLDIAETGLGMAGKLAGRAAPFLELLRPTSTQTQEQEEAELAKYRRLNNMLTEQKKKNRMPASEE
jgi:hypothetical protein